MSFRNWIISKLKNAENGDKIESVTSLGDSSIEVTSKEGKMIVVGVMENESISSTDIRMLCKKESKKPQILVGRSNAIWQGNAIDFARQENMGWGGMGNITDAFNTEKYFDIQKREYSFVENGLKRHTKVKSLERVFDRVFIIHRIGNLPPYTITLIGSYELSGEEVRNAIDTYGRFNAILNTNPNGNPTGKAYSAAAEIGAEIFIWRDLLGRLNKR